ncbi:MAG: methyltransferase protein [Verrucomicrobiales bacterium]|nr:methyltransferase protein [Verrucomicrobiales bacterium]
MSDLPDEYADIAYESCAHPKSHPASLAAVASLFGMEPCSLKDGAQVLEIGCAVGGNLLPMAAMYPASHFTGIDLSSVQITKARAAADELGLGNVTFYALGLEDLGPDNGAWDYIIAHGVYSWVAAPVRDKLMALCGRLLNPMGVACISYNTLPGSAARAALRGMVQFHTRHAGTLEAKVAGARALFAFLEPAFRDRPDGGGRAMGEELAHLREVGDFYIAHEHLERTNDPCYFHEFISHASRRGLRFLAEAEIHTMSSAGFPDGVRAGLRQMASNAEEAEQYGDFVRNRSFRQTLLCRAGVDVKRSISPDRVQHLHFASSLEPMPLQSSAGQGGGQARPQFRDPDGTVIQARDSLTAAALRELHAVWPAMLSFPDLLAKAAAACGVPAGSQEAAALGSSLLLCLSLSRGVEFRMHPVVFQAAVSDTPSTHPYCRWQAARGPRITSLTHQELLLGPRERQLLGRLDGTRSVAELEAEFPDAAALLKRFAENALLV